ncbi:MAG: hypothetical protein ACOZQL_35810 [Myxococcota bacterium]
MSAAKLEGLVLVAVGLFALAFQLWLPSTHVAEADYQAVAQVLAAERQPGDVVLLAPWWTERARLYVPDGLPVVGYQGSDGAALDAHPRIWVLAEPRLPNARLGAFEAAFRPARTAIGAERRFGNLSLQLFQNGRYRPQVLGDVLATNPQVYLEQPDGSRQPCTPQGRGFRCPNGRVVATEWHEVHFAPYQCLKLEAPGGATRAVVEFTSPAADQSALEAGYIWEYGAYKDGFTASTVWLEVNGQAQSLELVPGDELMHRLEGPALPEGARVRLALASQNPNARVVCLVLHATRRSP